MATYLDHNATSPMHPEVADAMMPFLQNPTGNPSSLHNYGRMARLAIESARAEDSLALNAIRVRFGMENSLQDVEAFVAKLLELMNKLPAVMRQAAG